MRGSSLRSGLLALALALAASVPAQAQAQVPTTNYQAFQQPGGSLVPPVVILCATGTNRDALPCGSLAAPLNVMSAPFVRASRSPFILPATTTPQQYMVTQPVGSTTYRGYNPCANADVRVMSVAPLEPIATQPATVNGKTLPGVLRVTSKTETVDEFSGTRLGRGPETLGSAANPNGGQDRIISIMLVPIPGYSGNLTGATCLYEHMYGKGS